MNIWKVWRLFCWNDCWFKDPSRKLWIGNIPEQAKWKDLQALVDQALHDLAACTWPVTAIALAQAGGKSKWVEIFRGKGKGTAAVVWPIRVFLQEFCEDVRRRGELEFIKLDGATEFDQTSFL